MYTFHEQGDAIVCAHGVVATLHSQMLKTAAAKLIMEGTGQQGTSPHVLVIELAESFRFTKVSAKLTSVLTGEKPKVHARR